MSADIQQNLNELGVIILTDRDRIEFNYLLKVRGERAIRLAITKLNGKRPYVSNMAKILKVDVPKDLPDPDKVLPIEKGLGMLAQVIRVRKRKNND